MLLGNWDFGFSDHENSVSRVLAVAPDFELEFCVYSITQRVRFNSFREAWPPAGLWGLGLAGIEIFGEFKSYQD